MELPNIFKKKQNIPAEELAQVFFEDTTLKVVQVWFVEFYEKNREKPEFRDDIFQLKAFTGSVAVVFLALANGRDKRGIDHVIKCFLQLVNYEMLKRWNYESEEAGSIVASESNSFMKLLFSDPEAKDMRVHFEWSTAWLLDCGIVEHNPVRLFLLGMTWKDQYIAATNGIAAILKKFNIK